MKFQDLKYCSSLTRFQEACRDNLGKDRVFTIVAFMKIWHKQTNSEKTIGETILKNWVGFDAFTSRKLSGMAKNIVNGNMPTNDEIVKIGYEMKKYIEQLYLIVHNKV